MTNWYVAKTIPRPADGHQDIMIVEDQEGGTYHIATMRCLDAGAQASRIVRSVNAYDPDEVYEVRVQIDQKVYVQGSIEEIVKAAFHEGYERGQDDTRTELVPVLSLAENWFRGSVLSAQEQAIVGALRAAILKARGEG